MTLNLKADSYVSSCGGYDPEDEWSRDSTSTIWSFGGILSSKAKDYDDVQDDYLCSLSLKEDDLKVGKHYWVRVAVWSTGDSFGYDTDYHASIIDIFNIETKRLEKESLESCGYPLGRIF